MKYLEDLHASSRGRDIVLYIEDIQAFPINMQCDVIRQETRQDFICTHF